MNRYIATDNNVFRRTDGKRALRTTTYPKIPVGYDDIYIIANETDYLDSLAHKFYRDVSLWWIIAQANGIKSTMKAPIGQQIRIPQNVEQIISNFKRSNI